MPYRTRISPSGSSRLSLPLRVLVALVGALLLAGPLTGVAADPAPTPSHVDHLGDAGAAGCRAFHDDAYCLSGRALSTPLLYSSADAGLPDLPTTDADFPPETPGSHVDDPHAAPLRARAPPRL